MSNSNFDPVTFSAIKRNKPLVGEALLVPNSFSSPDYADTGSTVDPDQFPELAKVISPDFSGETWDMIALPSVTNGLAQLGNPQLAYKWGGQYYLITSNGYFFKSTDGTIGTLTEVKTYPLRGQVHVDSSFSSGQLAVLIGSTVTLMDYNGVFIRSGNVSTGTPNRIRYYNNQVWAFIGQYFCQSAPVSSMSFSSINIGVTSGNGVMTDVAWNGTYWYLSFQSPAGGTATVYRSSNGQGGSANWTAQGAGTTSIASLAVGGTNVIAIPGGTGSTVYRTTGTSWTTVSLTVSGFTDRTNTKTTALNNGHCIISSYNYRIPQCVYFDGTTFTDMTSAINGSSTFFGGYGTAYAALDTVIFAGSSTTNSGTIAASPGQTFVCASDTKFVSNSGVYPLGMQSTSYSAPIQIGSGLMAMIAKTPGVENGGVTKASPTLSGLRSTDGKNWTPFTIQGPNGGTTQITWLNFTANDNMFICGGPVVGTSSYYGTTMWIGTSTDLVNWTWNSSTTPTVNAATGAIIEGVGTQNIVWRPVGGTTIFYSTNRGSTWTSVALAASDWIWYDRQNKVLHSLAQTGTTNMYSTDGITWTASPTGGASNLQTFKAVATGQKVAIFGGSTTTPFTGSKMLMSTDGGINYGVYDLPATVAVGNAWAANGIIGVGNVANNTYYYTKDGTNWTTVTYAGLTASQLYIGSTGIKTYYDTSTSLDGKTTFIAGNLANTTGFLMVSKGDLFIPAVTEVPSGLKYVIRAS